MKKLLVKRQRGFVMLVGDYVVNCKLFDVQQVTYLSGRYIVVCSLENKNAQETWDTRDVVLLDDFIAGNFDKKIPKYRQIQIQQICDKLQKISE